MLQYCFIMQFDVLVKVICNMKLFENISQKFNFIEKQFIDNECSNTRKVGK